MLVPDRLIRGVCFPTTFASATVAIAVWLALSTSLVAPQPHLGYRGRATCPQTVWVMRLVGGSGVQHQREAVLLMRALRARLHGLGLCWRQRTAAAAQPVTTDPRPLSRLPRWALSRRVSRSTGATDQHRPFSTTTSPGSCHFILHLHSLKVSFFPQSHRVLYIFSFVSFTSLQLQIRRTISPRQDAMLPVASLDLLMACVP